VQPIDRIGGQKFIEATLAKSKKINKEYDIFLSKYQIDYIVIDAMATYNPRLPEGSKQIYQTERFTIYEVL